jgi:RNA polymerase sigma-70 factor (ECF subfamily)
LQGPHGAPFAGVVGRENLNMAYALDIWNDTDVAKPAVASADVGLVHDNTVVREPLVAPVQDPDHDLLIRLAANDETAFRMLVERHIDRAFGIALRIVGSRADAEDVVQDTLLKVWTHRGSWQAGRAKFSTWLYRVITNRCIDFRRQPRSDDIDTVPEPADTRPDAASTLQRNETTALLEKAMEILPEQQRIAVILSYHEDMSNGEIAEVMSTTVSAVESLLKRGRQQLKATLRRHERDIRHIFSDC